MYRFHYPKDQLLIGRDVFVVALFATQPYARVAAHVAGVLDLWLKLIPEGALEWGRVGKNAAALKPFGQAMLTRARNELSPAKSSKGDLGAFTLCGGEDMFNPSFRFQFLGTQSTPIELVPHSMSHVEMRFPSDFPQKIGFDRMADFVRAAAEILPYRSGYASPALSRGFENMDHIHAGGAQIVPLAFRHPGYDLPENSAASHYTPANRCRGARWLTLLGPQIVKELGGADALRGELDARIQIVKAGTGLMLRAGDQPEIGDVNKGEFTPLLRSVAAAIEPATQFEDVRSLRTLFNDDEAQILRWERRHLD